MKKLILLLTIQLLTISMFFTSCSGDPEYRFEQEYELKYGGEGYYLSYEVWKDDTRIMMYQSNYIPYDEVDSVLDAHYIQAKNHIDRCKEIDKKLKHERNKFK